MTGKPYIMYTLTKRPRPCYNQFIQTFHPFSGIKTPTLWYFDWIPVSSYWSCGAWLTALLCEVFTIIYLLLSSNSCFQILSILIGMPCPEIDTSWWHTVKVMVGSGPGILNIASKGICACWPYINWNSVNHVDDCLLVLYAKHTFGRCSSHSPPDSSIDGASIDRMVWFSLSTSPSDCGW